MGLNLSAFIPTERLAKERELSREQVISELTRQHDAMWMLLTDRLNNIRILRVLWVQGNLKGVFEALRKISDDGTLVDFLNSAEAQLRKGLLTLDTARDLVPVLRQLLASKFESFVLTSLRYVKLLLVSFVPVIIETRKAALNRTVAMVDLTQEERITKCMGCFDAFRTLDSLVDSLAKRKGTVAGLARESKHLLDKLLASA